MNKCYNHLEISADTVTLCAMRSDIVDRNGRVSFDTLIPLPEDSPAGSPWYLNSWGVVNNATDSHVEWLPEVQALNAIFATPLCPPMVWLRALAAKYPDALMRMSSASHDADVHLQHSIQGGLVKLDVAESMSFHKNYWSEVLGAEIMA